MLGLREESEPAFASAVIMLILASIAVGLRLLTKKWTKLGYGVDDWWLLFALSTVYAYFCIFLWGLFVGGGGMEITLLIFDYAKLVHILKTLYILVPIYVLSVTAIKISILCLYRRIFPIASFRRASFFVDVLCVLWLIAALIVAILSCKPIRKFWNPLTPGRCLNFNTFFLSVEIANTLIDVIILCLPLSMIQTLHTPLRRKIGLSMMFLLGAFVCVTCIVRIIVTYQPHSAHISFSKGQVWSNIQLGMGIICACLPTYRPLLVRFKAVFVNLGQRYGSGLSHSGHEPYSKGGLGSDGLSPKIQSPHESGRRNNGSDVDDDLLRRTEVTNGSMMTRASSEDQGKRYTLSSILVRNTDQIV